MSIAAIIAQIFMLLVWLVLLALWIWMLVHCVTNAALPRSQKVIWFVAILLGNWIGALVYALTRPPGQRQLAPLIVMAPCVVLLALMFAKVVPPGIQPAGKDEALQARTDAIAVIARAQAADVDPSDLKPATEIIDTGDGKYKALAYKEATAQYRQAKVAVEKAIAHVEEGQRLATAARAAAEKALAAAGKAREQQPLGGGGPGFYTFSDPNGAPSRLLSWDATFGEQSVVSDVWRRTDEVAGPDHAAADAAFEAGKRQISAKQPWEAIASFDRARELAEKVVQTGEEIQKTVIVFNKANTTLWRYAWNARRPDVNVSPPAALETGKAQLEAGAFREARASFREAQGQLAVEVLRTIVLRSSPKQYVVEAGAGDRPPEEFVEQLRKVTFDAGLYQPRRGLSLPTAKLANISLAPWGTSVRYDAMPNEMGYTGIGDFATGLLWLESADAKRSSVKADEIDSAVALWNSQKPYGYADWRLPTAEELVSLMESKRDDRGAYLPPMFRPGIYWSTDTMKRPGVEPERIKVEYEFGTAAINGESVSYLSGGAYLRLVRTWWSRRQPF